MRTHYCGDLRTTHLGETVTLYGWVDRRRDHGGVIFLDLRDRRGIVQIASSPDQTPASYPVAEGLRNEYVVQVTGVVTKRPPESLNEKIPTGEIEIYADSIILLNGVNKQLPFVVSSHEAEQVREDVKWSKLCAVSWKIKRIFWKLKPPSSPVPPPKGPGIILFPPELTQGNGTLCPNRPNCLSNY